MNDVNEAPFFTSPGCLKSGNCQFETTEEGAIGTAVGPVIKAADPDIKQACQLKFSIVSLDKQYFKIGETSGIITTRTRIDRELKEYYSIDIKVEDCAKLFARATVRVKATDINDNYPRFPYASPLKLSISEDYALRKTIHTFKATGMHRRVFRISVPVNSQKGEQS